MFDSLYLEKKEDKLCRCFAVKGRSDLRQLKKLKLSHASSSGASNGRHVHIICEFCHVDFGPCAHAVLHLQPQRSSERLHAHREEQERSSNIGRGRIETSRQLPARSMSGLWRSLRPTAILANGCGNVK